MKFFILGLVLAFLGCGRSDQSDVSVRIHFSRPLATSTATNPTAYPCRTKANTLVLEVWEVDNAGVAFNKVRGPIFLNGFIQPELTTPASPPYFALDFLDPTKSTVEVPKDKRIKFVIHGFYDHINNLLECGLGAEVMTSIIYGESHVIGPLSENTTTDIPMSAELLRSMTFSQYSSGTADNIHLWAEFPPAYLGYSSCLYFYDEISGKELLTANANHYLSVGGSWLFGPFPPNRKIRLNIRPDSPSCNSPPYATDLNLVFGTPNLHDPICQVAGQKKFHIPTNGGVSGLLGQLNCMPN